MKFPFYHQLDTMDCGPTCLRMIAKHYGRSLSLQTLRDKSQINRDGVSLMSIAEAAESLGFRTMGAKVPFDVLAQEIPLPCIVHWDQNHFVVVYEVAGVSRYNQAGWLRKVFGGRGVSHPVSVAADTTDGQLEDESDLSSETSVSNRPRRGLIRVADPGKQLLTYSVDEFCRHWLVDSPDGEPEGIVLMLEPTADFYEREDEKAPKLGFQRLTTYLGQYRQLLSQIMLGVLVSSGIQLIYPFLTQSLVDVGVNTQNIPFIYIVLAALGLLLVGRQAVEFIRSWILLHISTRLNLSILSDFLIKLMRLPLPFFNAKQIGDIFRRVDDHRRIETFLTGHTLAVLFSLVDLVLLGLVMAYYDRAIFVVFMVGTLLHIGWAILFLRRRRVLDYKRFDLDAKKHNGLLELISGIQDIKLAAAERPMRWSWERLQARVFHLQTRALALNQYQHAGGFAALRGVNLLVMFLSAKAVIEGQMTLGAMLAIQFIAGQLNGSVEQIVAFVQDFQDAQISLERLNEIHTLADEEPHDRPQTAYLPHYDGIQIRNVAFAYPGMSDRPVLRGIDLFIPAHKTTAIVGMSGSGKTTLLKLLLKFYDPAAGEIRLGESTLRNLSHGFWRSHCGVVMQDGFIFSDTIARNIALGEDRVDHERLLHAMRVANIAAFVDSLPLGYNTKVGAEGNGLSQGQRQRILIARAVYKDPQFLFFDEATNALDANNEAAVIEALDEFFRGRTVVVVAHRLSTVKNADRIVVLDGGRIAEVGSHTELVARRGAYWQLVKNQLELDA